MFYPATTIHRATAFVFALCLTLCTQAALAESAPASPNAQTVAPSPSAQAAPVGSAAFETLDLEREKDRLAAIPWRAPKNIVVRFASEDSRDALLFYSTELEPLPYNKDGVMVANVREIDLNGDEHPDFALEYLHPWQQQPYATLSFFAGCGNGWYAPVLEVSIDTAENPARFSLHEPTPAHGLLWKSIEAPSSGFTTVKEKQARYIFHDNLYLREAAFALQAVPWLEVDVFLINLTDQRFADEVPCYKFYIMKEEGLADDSSHGQRAKAAEKKEYPTLFRLSRDYSLSHGSTTARREEVDLNGDEHPDLLITFFEDKEPFSREYFAGCGNGWYMKVFESGAPGCALGDTGENGWKTIVTTRADSSGEKTMTHDFIRKYYSPRFSRELVDRLAATPWVKNADRIYRISPPSFEAYTLTRANKDAPRDDGTKTPAKNTTKPNTDGTGQRFFLLPFQDSLSEDQGMDDEEDSYVKFTLNDDKFPDLVARVRHSYGSGGMFAYNFYAGCGDDFYVCVLGTEYMDEDFTTKKSVGRKEGGTFWRDILANERVRHSPKGDRPYPMSFRFKNGKYHRRRP